MAVKRVSTAHAAELLGISERQLRTLHQQTPQAEIDGAPLDVGGGARKALRWHPGQLETWLQARRAFLPAPAPQAPPAAPTPSPQAQLPLPPRAAPKTRDSFLARARQLSRA